MAPLQNQKIQTDGIRQAFDLQAAHYRQVGKSNVLERLEKLKRMGDWIMDHREEMQKAAYLDFRKPAAEVDLSEIWMLMTEIRHVRRNLKKWMRPRKVKTTLAILPAESWIQNEPKGLCLIIAPWNFPFSLTIYPLISAIAAGNCAILKPSELTPHCSALIEKMIKELYEENEVLVFQGDKLVAQALLELPFHHIFFTGSPQVGKKVMAAAALHLASVTLELGGKSPTIIDESADLKDTAEKIAWGKYINNGQICLAPDYVLIQESIADKFMPVLKASIKNIFGGDKTGVENSPDYGRIVNELHFKRLNTILTESIEAGAELIVGGDNNGSDLYFAPTVLSGITAESPIMESEIFGPILPLITFKNLNEVIDLINSKPRPLGLYIFSRNQKNIDFILKNTTAGSTVINDVMLNFMQLNLPFGGVNGSGTGRSHGKSGFESFSNQRSILKNIRHGPLKLLYPPHSPIIKKIINLILKYL